MERTFGWSFADVRVHRDESAGRLAADLDAAAFTRGRHIYFGGGRYEPGAESGRLLLAHELAHTLQRELPHAESLSEPDAPAERAATGAAARVAAGVPVDSTALVRSGRHSIQRQPASAGLQTSSLDDPAPADTTPAGPPPRELPGSLRVRIVAHASPRWRSAKAAGQADEENLDLSQQRAEQARDVVALRLQDLLGDDASISYEVDYGATEAPGSVALESEAHGSRDTLREAKGNRAANDPWYRRVDVYIDDTARTEKYAGKSQAPGSHKVEKKSRWWQVRVGVSFNATLGLSAGGLSLTLRNPYTGREGMYHAFGGGGGTLGVGVAKAWSDDYTDFYTDDEVGFEDFNKVNVRYTSGGIGLVFIGYQWSYLSFIGMGSGAQSIDVGGLNVGAHLELGGSVTALPLRADGTPQSDFYDEPYPDIGWNPYQSSHKNQYLHTALFKTGSPVLSPCERRELRKFVDRAAGRWAETPPPDREPEPCPAPD